MKFLFYNIVPLCLIGLAAYLIYLNRSGWGWVLVLAALLAVYPTSTKEKTKNDK
jgi:hypothetical protein